jgi:hypothetical protein
MKKLRQLPIRISGLTPTEAEELVKDFNKELGSKGITIRMKEAEKE